MGCLEDAVSLLLLAQGTIQGLASDVLNTDKLLFGPIRVLALTTWVYLCLYCVQRVEYSPLIAIPYKPVASVFCLVVGPFIFFVMAVADVATKLQEGDIGFGEIFSHLFGGSFHGREKAGSRKGPDENYIELLNSAGRDFFSEGLQSKDLSADQKTLKLAKRIILDGIKQRASDILIDPKDTGVHTVRYRVDGFLRVVAEIETGKSKAIVNSIKAIAGMDIAERRRALDGAFMAKIYSGNVYFRVASAGVLGGEKLSLRVLNQATGMLRLDQIGLSEESYRIVCNAVDQSQGMVVVCGPTGSGKTTSLYAMLNNLDFYARNIITVEDPIEYVLPNASQIEVNPRANITFANSLRNILRQDPDVICVGEIRDSETAGMAVQAAHTGHLVLATLHSSSNMATLARMIDLGIKPLMLASALNVIISQRLVRKLCENCKDPAELTDAHVASFQKQGIDPSRIMQANGCKKCNHTGFYGRVAIVDVLHLDDNIKGLLANDKLSIGDLKKSGDERGRNTLRVEGIRKVVEGITTLEEVKRVTSNLG